MAKKNIAIIGSGLAGATIAGELVRSSSSVNVTVIEKGDANLHQPKVRFVGKSFGLNKTFNIGIGGTTQLWHCGYMPLMDRDYEKWDLDHSFIRRLKNQVAEVLQQRGISRAYFQSNETTSHVSTIAIDRECGPEHVPDEVNLLDHSELTRVDFEEKTLYVTRGKERLRLNYDILVFSCGGLGSPILMNKIFRTEKYGKNLTDHPMGTVGKVRVSTALRSFARVRKDERFNIATPLVFTDRVTGLSHAFYLRPCFNSTLREDISLRKTRLLNAVRNNDYLNAVRCLFDLDLIYELLHLKMGVSLSSKWHTIFVVCEQPSVNCNAVSAADDGLSVNWEITRAEIDALTRNLNSFLEEFSSEINQIKLVSEQDLENFLFSSAHYSGTCFVRTDSKAKDLFSIPGYADVFVCDASVIPSTGVSNTGLTIIALAKLLVEDILNQDD